MTKFIKDTGIWPQPNGTIRDDGMYVHVVMDGDTHFVARFKYNRRDKANFFKFLKANFTVEEYLDAMKIRENSPVSIMEAKGYVSTTVKKMLKDKGYPLTPQGFSQMIKDEIEERRMAA